MRLVPEKGDLQVEPPGGLFTEPDDHGLGRSRGGLTTKLHLAVEWINDRPALGRQCVQHRPHVRPSAVTTEYRHHQLKGRDELQLVLPADPQPWPDIQQPSAAASPDRQEVGQLPVDVTAAKHVPKTMGRKSPVSSDCDTRRWLWEWALVLPPLSGRRTNAIPGSGGAIYQPRVIRRQSAGKDSPAVVKELSHAGSKGASAMETGRVESLLRSA